MDIKRDKTLEQESIDERNRKGDRLTGDLINSVERRLHEVLDSLGIEGRVLSYGRFIETGVTKDKIPYSGRTGAGGTSKYIKGLINWAMIKFGLSAKKDKGAAFAIAQNHLKSGMPTRGEAFTGFITKALNNKVEEITRQLFEANGGQLNFLVENMVARQQKNFPR